MFYLHLSTNLFLNLCIYLHFIQVELFSFRRSLVELCVHHRKIDWVIDSSFKICMSTTIWIFNAFYRITRSYHNRLKSISNAIIVFFGRFSNYEMWKCRGDQEKQDPSRKYDRLVSQNILILGCSIRSINVIYFEMKKFQFRKIMPIQTDMVYAEIFFY